MPMIKLDVPVEAQEMDNCCWHTSAYMIWLYWQQNGKGAGPMNTVASAYAVADTKGLFPKEFVVLAQKVGMFKLWPNAQHQRGRAVHDAGSPRTGPIWSAGYWFGGGHVIVVTGVDKGQVLLQRSRQGRQEDGHPQVVQRQAGAHSGLLDGQGSQGLLRPGAALNPRTGSRAARGRRCRPRTARRPAAGPRAAPRSARSARC